MNLDRRDTIAPAFWEKGEKKRVSNAAGIRIQHLSAYLARRASPGKKRARQLTNAGILVLGEERAPRFTDWIDNGSTRHPAFAPQTLEESILS